QSVSRLLGELVTPEVRDAGRRLRSALARYREKEDLIAIGAYQPGADPLLDRTVALRAQIDAFLRQAVDEPSRLSEADEELVRLADMLDPPAIADSESVTAGAAAAVAPGNVVPTPPPAPGASAIPSLRLS